VRGLPRLLALHQQPDGLRDEPVQTSHDVPPEPSENWARSWKSRSAKQEERARPPGRTQALPKDAQAEADPHDQENHCSVRAPPRWPIHVEESDWVGEVVCSVSGCDQHISAIGRKPSSSDDGRTEDDDCAGDSRSPHAEDSTRGFRSDPGDYAPQAPVAPQAGLLQK